VFLRAGAARFRGDGRAARGRALTLDARSACSRDPGVNLPEEEEVRAEAIYGPFNRPVRIRAIVSSRLERSRRR